MLKAIDNSDIMESKFKLTCMNGLPCRYNGFEKLTSMKYSGGEQRNLRKEIWLRICEVDPNKKNLAIYYSMQLTHLDDSRARALAKTIYSFCQSLPEFKNDDDKMYNSLSNLCVAYENYSDEVGFMRGM
jgi:hypothetical protein